MTAKVRGQYVLEAGDSLTFTDETAFQLVGGAHPPSLVNFGSISVQLDQASSSLSAIVSTADAAGAQVLNKSGGTLSISSSGFSDSITGVEFGADGSLNNKGEIHVTALSKGAATGVSTQSGLLDLHNDGLIDIHGFMVAWGVVAGGDANIVNTGDIEIRQTSPHYGAYGINVAGQGSLDNSGDIRITTKSQGEGITFSGGVGGFNNSGSIVVLSSGEEVDPFAVSLRAAGGDGPIDLYNSGLIQAYNGGLPVTALSAGSITGATPADYVLHNTGRIFGAVGFDGGADQVENAGKIVGDVYMGKGDDRFENTGKGSVEGFVTGLDGDDVLIGGRGADTLRGDDSYFSQPADGDDLLSGRGGDDNLSGGDGHDTLIGGAGADTLAGGHRSDVFVYQSVHDSGAAHQDLITDLDSQDSIDLSAIDANKQAAGDQAFALVDHLDGHAGQAALSYDASADVTLLELDVNGDGQADAVVRIAGDQAGFTGFVL